MRVLVTGAFGFLGTAVVDRLARAGHEVVALTHQPEGTHMPPSAAIRVVRGDVREAGAMRRAVVGADAVCHLAALARVRESFEQPEMYFDVNVEGTRVLLSALRGEAERVGRRLRVVQASTAAVYGTPAHQPVAEDAPPAPTSPYGESKLAADRLVLDAAGSHLDSVVLRMFNIAGAALGRIDDDLTRIIPKALAVAKGTAEQLEVNGDGTAVRDFVHVDDAARAFSIAVDHDLADGSRVFNLGATGATVAEIIGVVEQVTGIRLRVVHLPPKPEPPRLMADASRIRAELGWKPERSSLAQIVSDAWQVVAND